MPALPLLLLCDHAAGVELPPTEAWAPGYRVQRSASLRQTLEILASEGPAVIALRPLAARGMAEIHALERVRAGSRPIPLLLLLEPAALDGALSLVDSLGVGPWEIASDRSSPGELALRLGRLARENELQGGLRELAHRASHDDRTELLRPLAFEERLREHFSAAQRHGMEIALVLIDMDAFGRINKDHDHTTGDQVLSGVGAAIRSKLRAEDVAGRIGGDEFAVLLPYTGKLNAALVASRIRMGIAALTQAGEGGRPPIAVSASIGFETFDGTDLGTLAELRAHAERALRAAKERGGNQLVYFRSMSEPPPEAS